jgi:hypothetical protein
MEVHQLKFQKIQHANISPLMDILFGTYVCPNKEPKQFGIKEPFPSTYFGQMLKPFLPNRIWKIIERSLFTKPTYENVAKEQLGGKSLADMRKGRGKELKDSLPD